MYIYCVYHAMSKSPKQFPNRLKIAQTSFVLTIVNGVFYHVHYYPSLYMNQVPIKLYLGQ